MIDILNGRRRGVGASLLRGALTVASWPYSVAMRARRLAYRCGLLRTHKAAVPVICVGNITTGGTGKTPMVAWVVAHLKSAGMKPAILTRGYKAADGTSDEAQLLKQLTGVPVIVEADRRAGAEVAVAGGADVLVMDDGFQHRRLARDLDIVLIDATDPFGLGRCLPRGLLREPPAALAEAGAIVITRCDSVEPAQLELIRSRLGRYAPQASLHQAVHSAVDVLDAAGESVGPEALQSMRVLGFCGLGNPESFFDSIRKLGATVVATKAFDDHATYTPERLAMLGLLAETCEADVMLTTQKDAVKLVEVPAEPDETSATPFWTLAVEMVVTKGADELTGLIDSTLADRAAAGGS